MHGYEEIITLAASAARTPTAGTNGDAYAVWRAKRAVVVCEFTAKATDEGDTCDVYVDVSPDAGTTWLNAVHFTQALGNGTDAAKEYAVLDSNTPGTSAVDATSDAASGAVRPALFGGLMRARWVIVNTGTANASFTFKVTAYLQG